MISLKSVPAIMTALFLLSNCQNGSHSPQHHTTNRNATQTTQYFANLKQSPVENQVTVRLSSSDFAVKSSHETDGTPGKKIADVQSLELFLVRNASAPPPGTVNPANGETFAMPANLSGGSQDFSFRNMGPGNYYICAAAFDGPDPATSNNITKDQGYSYGRGPCVLSYDGGESGGRVRVNGNYTINGSNTLLIQIPLLDGTPNSIQFEFHMQTYNDD